LLGGVDDYVKLRGIGKHRGLSASSKFLSQAILAGVIGVFVYLHPSITTNLDIPFFKKLVINLGPYFVFWVTIVVVGASNAVNLTDGLDGLAIGTTLMVAFTLGALSYITGNAQMSEYLLIPHVPGTGELTVFCAAIVGASLGFLWFNCHPATVFMGDVGSLPLGGCLGMIAVLIKKELWLVVLGGVFVIEAGSVILQVISFKTTGKRIFKMSPFHHHLQLSGWNENKIIVRFWILAIILAMLTLTTVKIR
jgi:phospho-N-acetylmuramoyl-pentapeptide-transferase